MNNIIKKYRFPLVILLVVLILSFVGMNYINSFQKVSVIFESGVTGVTAKVYAINGKNDEANPSDIPAGSKEVKSLTSSSTVKLKKGSYIIKTEDNKDYETYAEEIDLNEKPAMIEVNPNYSSEKLNQLLGQQESQIKQAIKEQVVNFSDYYRIDNGKLYKHGDWYATTIRQNLSDEEMSLDYHDAFRLVAKKDGDSWKVVTLPPELILSKYKYPEVPVTILEDINKVN